MKRVILISMSVCTILLFSLTGCGKTPEKDIEGKLNAELEYVEDLIFKVANKHAKGEYLEEDKFKWEDIKGDMQKINSTWNTLILDLTEVNVSNQDIIGFSNDLNDLLISVSKESEVMMLEKLNDMYAKVIVFKEAYLKDKSQIQKNKIKSEVLSIYVLTNKDDYESAKTKIASTIDTYKSMMNDIQYAEENAYNLNKIYVLLEEFSNAIQTQNYDLVRMKYIVTVENL